MVFVNKRIEAPFAETYKGYNQYLYTGGIDDLFLMDSSEQDGNLKLCRIAEALAEYGKKAKYDLVIIINDELNLEFATPAQEELFNRISKGTSESLVEEGRKGKTFVPRTKRNQAESRSAENANNNNDSQTAQTVKSSTENVQKEIRGNDSLNRFGLVTRVLKNSTYKTLVIFPYPEKMIAGGDADGSAVQRIETLVKDWRDIIREANSETRTVLIVNPHRLKEFHNVEKIISCYDHNCKEVQIPQPSYDEMKAWLSKYKLENNIQGSPRDAERVVLTGKTNVDGNLQNFVSWVQSFYQKNPRHRTWKALLNRENIEAAESKDDILEKLDKMIGLAEVKEEIHRIVNSVESNNATASEASYHMFFLGNPGTGKTEVANLIAKLFWAMELRTSKKTVSIAIHDIVSQYNEGDTLQRMKDKIQEAMGGVLFIDEAYLFAESEWGRKAFQILLTEMENNRKNLTVILAGYEERLQALKDINPGIDSRIPYKLHFKDYTKEEKLSIFELHLGFNNTKANMEQTLSEKAKQKLLRVLDGCEGNGRGVRSVLEKTLKNADGAQIILETHVVDPHEVRSDEAESILAEIDREFIGMSDLKLRLRHYFQRVKWSVARNKALGITKRTGLAYRIRFTGPPGTGKTTIARYMGRFFHAMGICETSSFKECGATSLKGAYIGHAQQAVNNLFHENRGKVIFIDEIYSLYNPEAHQDDSFSREVIDTMVRCLTAEEYQNTVVIVAGYKAKVDQFMNANPGLASRIPDEIPFGNYSAEDCSDIFVAEADKNMYKLQDGCRDKLIQYFNKLLKEDNFGNARTVKEVFSLVESNIIDRLAEKNDKTETDFTQITAEDIPAV